MNHNVYSKSFSVNKHFDFGATEKMCVANRPYHPYHIPWHPNVAAHGQQSLQARTHGPTQVLLG